MNLKIILKKHGIFCELYYQIQKTSLPDTINVDDTNICDPKIMAEKFNTHFANVGKLLAASLNANDTDFLTYLKYPCPFSVNLYPTSPQEIIRIINSFHLNKACDYDDISPFLLKTAAHVIAYPLSIIFNHCISLVVFPNQLKVAKVIPVYRCGSSNDLQNYRPISLLSSLSKIFKKVILRRLVFFLERNNLIIPSQFGFRHKHCTFHPILDLLTECC